MYSQVKYLGYRIRIELLILYYQHWTGIINLRFFLNDDVIVQ